MPEKGENQSCLLYRSSFVLQWRLYMLTGFVFLVMVFVWSLDGVTIKSVVKSRKFTKQFLTMKPHTQHPLTNLTEQQQQQQETLQNFSSITKNITADSPLAQETNSNNTSAPPSFNTVLKNDKNVSFPQSHSDGVLEDPAPGRHQPGGNVKWVSTELEPNLTTSLLSRWLAPGGEPCRESPLDGSKNLVCLGGDYFETDLSGETWKSRPLVRDFGNGSYSISLQVHPDFAGDYNLTVILLYRHFEGLKFSPWRFAFDKQLRKFQIKFVKGHTQLPKIETCQKSDFIRDLWLGRWTRYGKNDGCQISNDGRYRCLAPDFPCQSPWCSGSLGLLESNGWVYSSHCSFRLFSADSAWNCLKNRWIFFWGDSNHVDTIRNMLNFVLDLPQIPSVPRRFDMNFSNPNDASQNVRITSIFNGHWNETLNYEGFNSLADEGFRNLLKKYFSEDTLPDTIIMNSGLHDGVHWRNLRSYTAGADYAASFWKEVMDSVRQRGLAVPHIFYRTTVATGGYARTLQFNPNKMEVFNWVALEKFRQAGLVTGVIDDFDMTFPWHFDNRCNDGVHYGRGPAKMKWRDVRRTAASFAELASARSCRQSCHLCRTGRCKESQAKLKIADDMGCGAFGGKF
ncbi:hypothetical protein OIU76_010898 [Salix suchowensis]|nr:hypothetical protein OIU76_010898 [Salix suchowensis]